MSNRQRRYNFPAKSPSPIWLSLDVILCTRRSICCPRKWPEKVFHFSRNYWDIGYGHTKKRSGFLKWQPAHDCCRNWNFIDTVLLDSCQISPTSSKFCMFFPSIGNQVNNICNAPVVPYMKCDRLFHDQWSTLGQIWISQYLDIFFLSPFFYWRSRKTIYELS